MSYWLPDLHLGYISVSIRCGRWLKKINLLQPDLVIVAGDILTMSMKPLRTRRRQRGCCAGFIQNMESMRAMETMISRNPFWQVLLSGKKGEKRPAIRGMDAFMEKPVSAFFGRKRY